MDPSSLAVIVPAGFLMGVLMGLTGVGAVILMIPFLIIAVGLPAAQAVGANLVYAALTKILGAVIHYKHRNFDPAFLIPLLYGSLPGILAGVAVLYRVEVGGSAAEALILRALAVVLVAAGLLTLFQKPSREGHGGGVLSGAAGVRRASATGLAEKGLLMITGGLVGFITTITSIGSGVFVAAALANCFGMQASQVVGITMIYGAIVMPVAAILHGAFVSDIPWKLVIGLLAGSLPGVWLGSRLVSCVPERFLRVLLGAIIIISAVRLW